jgi:hypothetical protein
MIYKAVVVVSVKEKMNKNAIYATVTQHMRDSTIGKPSLSTHPTSYAKERRPAV